MKIGLLTQNEGPTAMFWGCFSKAGVGPLVAIDGKIKSSDYKKIVENNILPIFEESTKNLIFMQDNAPIHKAKLVIEFLREKEIETFNWQPQSLDLNPIDNMWAILKSKRARNFPMPKSKKELIAQTEQIWYEFGEEICINLSNSMIKRLNEVIKKNGRAIDY